MKLLNKSGQALIEYILLFGALSLLGINLINGLNKIMDKTVGDLGFTLTEVLKTGVCKKNCFYDGFRNQ